MIYTLTLNPSIDQFITVKKLVPKDKLKGEDIRLDPGGKGFNVSRVVQELGGKTKAFGVIGGHTGEMVKDLLLQRSIPHDFCQVDGETRTNLIINDRSTGAQTRINPPGPRLRADDVKRLLGLIERASPRPSYWAICGSLPPGVPDNIYQRLIAYLQKRGERCVLDSDDQQLKLGLKAKPFMIKPNVFELERLLGRACKNREQILKAGRQLTAHAEVVAITLAEKGAYIVTKNDAWHLPALDVKVKSDVGAGDSFIGGFLWALDAGKDLHEASRWAVAAATGSIMREGTAQCQRRDVNRLIKQVTLKSF
ncbi:MAG: 1-phosphofructokinase [Candidatus Omnitrophica bacterium]|nr:1-phosphofructokinase [Candidatus Omnitrophota bacterium]